MVDITAWAGPATTEVTASKRYTKRDKAMVSVMVGRKRVPRRRRGFDILRILCFLIIPTSHLANSCEKVLLLYLATTLLPQVASKIRGNYNSCAFISSASLLTPSFLTCTIS